VAQATSGSPIERLIADLQSSESVRRDAAVARLRVLGARALPRLSSFIESSESSRARALALSALDGIADPRATRIALTALASSDIEVVVAALGVLRSWVTQETGTDLLETITALAVDTTRDARIRVAAVEALSDLPERLVQPIRAQAPPPESGGPSLDDPVSAREWVEAHGHQATLSTLHDVITAFREREGASDTPRTRTEWLKARGAAHGVLAERDSRLALYDAKETISAARGPLPRGFLDAMSKTGDPSCLEPMAQAWTASRDAVWKGQLTDAARQIMRRSRLTGRSAVVKDIRASWPGFL